ncbi:hypothetical protein GLOIN_2v1777367 [Rhizophagus clarus]|uniref:Uncharacterized protein n=1 Tax=Rhizophagus clarus TaxID=94130 RepID=A0A8H3R532_9GLOM|nr:hypothetical protein GLOIN_2v1777367 [Rhizophagus clarus]
MTYIKCKIWSFSDDLIHQKERWEAMKTGHRYYTVKALIDTSSRADKISKNLANRLGRKYGNYYKNKKEKDRLFSSIDKILNNFEVNKDHYLKANLILGLPWLSLREVEINIQKGIKIYGNFILFCKYLNNDKPFYNFESDSSKSDSAELRKELKS